MEAVPVVSMCHIPGAKLSEQARSPAVAFGYQYAKYPSMGTDPIREGAKW